MFAVGESNGQSGQKPHCLHGELFLANDCINSHVAGPQPGVAKGAVPAVLGDHAESDISTDKANVSYKLYWRFSEAH